MEKKKSPDRTPEGIEIFSPQFFQVFQHSSVNHLQIASPAIHFCADLSISRFKLYNVCYKSVYTRRHGGHIGVPKQWNGGHVQLFCYLCVLRP